VVRIFLTEDLMPSTARNALKKEDPAIAQQKIAKKDFVQNGEEPFM